MSTIEELKRNQTECCLNCDHYMQHFVDISRMQKEPRFVAIDFGHCCYPRLKNRMYSDWCERFMPKTVEEKVIEE